MPKSNGLDQKPNFPQKDAVKQLRDRFKQRKSEINPSAEMDEIVIEKSPAKEENSRKIAKPIRREDLDLP